METKIVMRLGEVEVHGVLNDGVAARALAVRLPLTLRMSGTGIDLCGQLPFSLPVDPKSVHRGWSNGDINYCLCGGWFALLLDDEENSGRYGEQLTLGHVEGPLDVLRGFVGSRDARIEAVGCDVGEKGAAL